MEELARTRRSLKNQTYVPKDLLETDCDRDDVDDWPDEDPETPGVRDDWSRGLCEMEESLALGEGGGFLSRAGSLASIKIRHQMTVLKMFFGNNNNE